MTEPIVAGLPVDDLAPLTGDSQQLPPPPAPKPQAPAKQDVAPVAIDWSKVNPSDIPEALVKQTDPFKSVLTESVERRQQIKALKDQVGAIDAPPKAPVVQADPNEPQWAKDLRAELATVKDLASTNGRKALLDEAMKAHNLPAGSERWITATTPDEIKAQAAELSKTFLTPGAGGSAGNTGVIDQVDRYRQAINARIKGSTGPIDPVEGSLFNPQFQDRIG